MVKYKGWSECVRYTVCPHLDATHACIFSTASNTNLPMSYGAVLASAINKLLRIPRGNTLELMKVLGDRV